MAVSLIDSHAEKRMAASFAAEQTSAAYAGHFQRHESRSYRRSGSQTAFALFGVPTAASFEDSSYEYGASGAAAASHSFSAAAASLGSKASCNCHEGQLRVYPWKANHVRHTHASYRRDTLTELIVHKEEFSHSNGAAESNGTAHPSKVPPGVIAGIPTPPLITPASSQYLNPITTTTSITTEETKVKGIHSWALCLPIPIPQDLPEATLESVKYTIRYASFETGSASIQTDLVLAHGDKFAEGIVTDYSKIALYHHNNVHGGTYGPPMLNEAVGMSLASVPAFKNASSGWSHYLDHQKICPNVRIGGEDDGSYADHAAHRVHLKETCQVYLFFNVYEYPGADAQRSLSVDVSATWNDGEDWRQARESIKEREVREIKLEQQFKQIIVETERLTSIKRDVEVTIKHLEESVRKATEDSRRRIKEEREIERELKEHEKAFLDIEAKAREEYNIRIKEEMERLRELDEKERKVKEEHEKRTKEEEERHREFEDIERKAQEEHTRRIQEEERRLKEIALAEDRIEAEQEKWSLEERARMKQIEEVQRKFKEETIRKTKEYTERHSHEEEVWKKHEEAERKAQEQHLLWMKEEAARLRQLTETEERVKAEHEIRMLEEQMRLKEIEEAQRRLREESELRAQEEAERRTRDEAAWKAHEESERRTIEEMERWTKEQAAATKVKITEREEHSEEYEERKVTVEETTTTTVEEVETSQTTVKSTTLPSRAKAPKIADEMLQTHIAMIAEKLDRKCENGYAWERSAHGYRCAARGHFLSFEELGMS